MKKFLIILLLLSIIFVFVACDTNSVDEFFKDIFGGVAPAPSHGPIK